MIKENKSQKLGGWASTNPQATSEDERVLSLFGRAACFSGVTGGIDVDPAVSEGRLYFSCYKIQNNQLSVNSMFLACHACAKNDGKPMRFSF